MRPRACEPVEWVSGDDFLRDAPGSGLPSPTMDTWHEVFRLKCQRRQ